MKILMFIISVFILISLLSCDVLKNNPDNSPYTYNCSVEGFVIFENGTPDTITATVRAYKVSVSTLMGETISDTNGYYFMDKLTNGVYQFNISANDYEEYSIQNIELFPDSISVVDTIKLEVVKLIEQRSINIDGTIDSGWVAVYTNDHESDWGINNNFEYLYLARDEDSLYVAVQGGFDSEGNTVNIYIDKDYGEETGINDFASILGGDYGNHLRKTVEAPETFGADLAYSGWALQYQVSVVSFVNPSAVDQNILNATISANDAVIEFAIPFSEIYENGSCPVGTKIALIAIIGGGGDEYVSDDTIPQQEDPHTFMTVFSRQY